jgi:transglutaminase/protease-like cytokinesis protein 3
MKALFRFLLLLLPLSTFAQTPYSNFYQVDERAKYLPITTPDSLARQLTFPYTKDIEKVRAIFRWITENISYNVKPARKTNTVETKNYLYDDPADTGALKPLSERVAIEVLNRRIAFCDGYARLFSTLCNYAGIQSEVITGYANGSMNRRKGRFGSNHRWNAVKIDSSWYLLDATWASGYVTYGSNDFIKSYNDFYFLTSPKAFARDHYPEDPKWTLLSEIPNMFEFEYSPFKAHAFSANNIVSYLPKSGIIEAKEGDTLRFELEASSPLQPVFIVDTPYVDSAVIATAKQTIRTNQWTSQSGKKAIISYVVTSPNTQWLSIICNEMEILRYKLNVQKIYTALVN